MQPCIFQLQGAALRISIENAPPRPPLWYGGVVIENERISIETGRIAIETESILIENERFPLKMKGF